MDMTTIELPVVLRDLLRTQKLHREQAYYEVIEEALLFWMDHGGWRPLEVAPVDLV
jgi:hypothetical protein